MPPWPYRSALVTGASSGIGEALARQAAARGSDLILVARRADRLHDLAGQLRGPVSVEVLAADLATAPGVETVERRIRDGANGANRTDGADGAAPIDLLINNAGRTPQPIGPLAQQDPAAETQKIAVNVTALMRLTQAALPGMQARGRGGILNVSSFAAFVPQPNAAVYAASKAFVTSFSESVHSEVSRHGIHVTTLAPGFTRRGDATERGGMKQRPMPEMLWLDRDEVATAALDAVAAGDVLCVPGRPYQVLALFARIAPRALVRRGFELLWPAPRGNGGGGPAESGMRPGTRSPAQ